jgi:pilus assembly protein Flp/PilA
MTNYIRAFVNDESGASAAEYALILAIVGAGIAGAAILLGTAIANAVNFAAGCINTYGVTCTT